MMGNHFKPITPWAILTATTSKISRYCFTVRESPVSNSSMHATVRLVTFAILLLAAHSLCRGQQVVTHLNPDRLESFELETNQERTFFIELDKGAFAAFDWLVSDDASLSIDIYNSKRQTLLRQMDPFENALSFFAAKKDRYLLVAKLSSNEKTGSHKVSLQYKASFSIPRGPRLKSSRKINGYEIRILSAERGNDSIVAILRNGRVLGGLRAGGGDTYGYYFGDDLTKAYTTNEKRGMNLIATTPDKTGDGIPDVMINYYSGGAHCCSLTYFLNLGEVVEIVELVNTSHDGLIAKQKIRRGPCQLEKLPCKLFVACVDKV